VSFALEFDMTLQRQIQGKSDSDLARYQAGLSPDTEGFILAEREWQRRAMVEAQDKQYADNRKLLVAQVKWMKFSIIATLAAAMLGALAAWYLGKPS